MRLGERSRLIAISGLLLAFMAAGCGARKQPPASEAQPATEAVAPVLVTQAEVGPIRQVVTLTGSVEPWRQVEVEGEIAGTVAWVGYEVGDRVRAGAPLLRLDTALAAVGGKQSAAAESVARARFGQTRVGLQLTREETAIAVQQAQKALENSRNRLAQAKTSAQLTRSRVEDVISQARIALSSDRTRLEQVKAGSRTQELAQAQARVEQAKTALRLAKVNLTRNQNLLKDGAVATAQVDAAQADFENAEAQSRIATQALDLAKEGARTEEVRLAELAVSQAERSLQEAEAQRGQSEVAQRDVRAGELAVAQAEDALRLAQSGLRRVAAGEQDVRAARASVGQAAAGVSLSKAQLGKHVVYAPVSGLVAERLVEPGAGAGTSTPLLRLVVLDPVRVVATTSELEVSRMRVGQLGTVTVDSLPGQRFAGRITDIAPQASSDSRNFAVRLQISNPGYRLRAGMFARIEIVTGTRPDATLIPRDALVERGADRVVYAVVGDQVKVRKVRIGAVEGLKVEVTAGLKSGDTVILGGQSLLADGQKVKPQPRNADRPDAPQRAESGA
jgi:HlyD family secretion protein